MVDVNVKLNNSQQRLEDILLESSRKNRSKFEENADDSAAALGSVGESLRGSQEAIIKQVIAINRILNAKFAATRNSLTSRIQNSDKHNREHFETIMAKLKVMLEMDITDLNEKSVQIQETTAKEFSEIKCLLTAVDDKMQKCQKDINDLTDVI